MVNLKNAFRFIIRNPFQSLIVLLTVIVSIGVQFFILSIGTLLETMIIDQSSAYQDHLIVNNYFTQNTKYDDLDFNLLKSLKDNDSNIKHAHYFLKIDGDIIALDNQVLTPSIRLNLHAYSDHEGNGNYLDYVGLNKKEHLTTNSKVANSNELEIMLDVNYAQANNLFINQIITYKDNKTNNLYNFKIVGTYDIGIIRLQNDYTFISLEKFEDLSSDNFSINIQLHQTNKTDNSSKLLATYLDKDRLNIKTWADVFPEIKVLNEAQEIVVLLIEVFISLAFFIILLSILNYSVKKKHSQFGILKSLGQTNLDILKTLLLQVFIIAIVGAIVGLLGGSLAIKLYESKMTYPDGTRRFIINLNFTNYLIPLLLTIGSALLASFISFLRMNRLAIIELIKEK